MATYYDALGLPADAPREAIERSLEVTQARLRQMGQWEQQRDLFRKIEATLLDPDARREYDMQVTLRGAHSSSGTSAKPPSARASKPAPKAASKPPAGASEGGAKKGVRRGVLIAAAAVLVLGLAYGGWLLLVTTGAPAEVGQSLLDPGSGETVGVVLAQDPAHLFPGKPTPSPALLIYIEEKKKAAWIGEAIAGIRFEGGGPASESLLKEGREAAKGQDLHQSLY